MTIYLYVKTHNKTGLKYLGKTKQNPTKYKGSGKRWKNHIKVHGNDVTTKILLATEDEVEIRETGLFFSKIWNVVESQDWANLKPETGDGGACYWEGMYDHLQKISSRGGFTRASKGYPAWNKGKTNIYSLEQREKISEARKKMKGVARGKYKKKPAWFSFRGKEYSSIPDAMKDARVSYYTVKKQLQILQLYSEQLDSFVDSGQTKQIEDDYQKSGPEGDL